MKFNWQMAGNICKPFTQGKFSGIYHRLNASMLSIELGTHLTETFICRVISVFIRNLFVLKVLILGREPETLSRKWRNPWICFIISLQLFLCWWMIYLFVNIAVRYAVRDVAALKQLTLFLISNIGNPISANKLIGMYGINSATTFWSIFPIWKIHIYLILCLCTMIR